MHTEQTTQVTSKTTADYLFYTLLVVLALLTLYVMLFTNHGAAGHATDENRPHSNTSTEPHVPSHN